MLTTSPIITNSANASPSAFHYAPARSPHASSPSRLSAVLPRRQPSNSARPSPTVVPMTSPSRSRSRHYESVDAGTQYSPMEDAKPNQPQGMTTPAQPPPPPRPQPMDPATASLQQPPVSAVAQTAVTMQSPTKRRNLQSHAVADAAGSNVDQAESSSAAAKRLRTLEAPPKALPRRYELCDVEDLVVLIARMLAELIETNDVLALRSGSLTRFHSRTAPGISVLDYLHRLAKHATLTPPLLLSMVYYIDRLCALYPEFTINTLTVHRFLITAATVAAKGLSDSFWNNTTYARVGGVRVAELKLLELEFLYRVDWKIVPNPEVLVAYYRGLVERCPGYVLEDEKRSLRELEPSATIEGDDDDVLDESDVVDDDEDGDTGTGDSGSGSNS